MFEKYLLCDNTLRNTRADGRVVGFAVDVRLAYYRGLALSMVEGFELSVDGEVFSPDSMTLHVAGERFSFAELATEAEARWEFDETATLSVAKVGGLGAGAHVVAIVEILRISYMPEPARRAATKTMQLQP